MAAFPGLKRQCAARSRRPLTKYAYGGRPSALVSVHGSAPQHTRSTCTAIAVAWSQDAPTLPVSALFQMRPRRKYKGWVGRHPKFRTSTSDFLLLLHLEELPWISTFLPFYSFFRLFLHIRFAMVFSSLVAFVALATFASAAPSKTCPDGTRVSNTACCAFIPVCRLHSPSI